MTARKLRSGDIPILQRMAEETGYPYPDLTRCEAVWVVVDELDRPVMAVAAQRMVELYLYPGPKAHPAAKLHALRLLHDAMGPDLAAKGYSEVNAFLPPMIAAKFGRRLARSFGWVKNWPSWCKRLA